MKAIYLAAFICLSFASEAQVSINHSAIPPHASAMLDIGSTNRGLLVPRMTQAQRNAIASPATGLMVFQTDNTPGFYFNRGTTAAPVWIMLGAAANPFNVLGTHADDGGLVNVGNADLSHRLILFGGRQNDPNPFISWKQGDPLRFVTDEGGLSEKMRITSGGNVGIGTTTPASKLDVAGEINVNSHKIINVSDPVNAQDVATKAYVDALKGHYVGEIYGGGVVFYVDNSRQHGLIAEYDFLWAIWSNVQTQIGLSAQSPWDGFSNALAIYNQPGMTASAAKTCFLHQSWTGMDDWFLPSIGQLNLLYNVSYELNYSLSSNINFTEIEGLVWSSTEAAVEGNAKAFDLSNGVVYTYPKTTSLRVRPIRKF